MLRLVRYLAPALALLALAGCGGQGPPPEQQVRETVVEFGRATAAKDYGVLCDRLLAPELVEDVTSIGLPCEQALARGLGDVREPRLTVGRVQVDGDRASAEIRTAATGQEPSEDTLKLVKVDGRWKISSLGT
jgi:predicted small lipoprotein YifL